MIKMLMIGELNETLYSLNEYLAQSFQIQLCPESADNVKNMMRLYRPGILVINIQTMEGNAHEVLETLQDRHDHIPVVLIGMREMEEELEAERERFRQCMVIYRPLRGQDVLRECQALLGQDTAAEWQSGVNKLKGGTASVIRKKILVIDDSALVLRDIKSLLEPTYEPILARSGEKGLEFIRKKKPDLVLLDYDMPGMDGREVFEEIKADEELKDIPVIFLTSVAQKDQIIAVLRNIPQGYILKPPAKDKLLTAIEEALKLI